MTYKGLAKGRIIELEKPLPYCDGRPVTVSVQPFPLEPQLGSPQAILKVLQTMPNIAKESVDELENLIKQGSLPVRPQGEFDGSESDDGR